MFVFSTRCLRPAHRVRPNLPGPNRPPPPPGEGGPATAGPGEGPQADSSRSPSPRLASLRARLAVAALCTLTACAPRYPSAQPTRVVAAAEPAVTPSAVVTTLADLYPPNTRSVHRVLIHFGKRQFACDGFLVINADGQRQLALISSLGLVTAVQCDLNRQGTVRQVTPLFREDWARDFVLRDLQLLFTPPPALSWLGHSTNGDWVWSTAGPEPDLSTRYLFNPDPVQCRALEVLRGERLLYRATFDDYRVLDGRRVPGQIHVDAGPYQLQLRVADVRRASPAAP